MAAISEPGLLPAVEGVAYRPTTPPLTVAHQHWTAPPVQSGTEKYIWCLSCWFRNSTIEVPLVAQPYL